MSHVHRDRHGERSPENRKRVAIVLAMTAVYMLAEVVGGLLTGSLALLADAGHMLTDVGGLALAYLAMRFAERPASPAKTFGYYRVEILAALANAVVLIGISLYILYEAYERLLNPPKVQSAAMLGVAAVGLIVNLGGAAVLRGSASESLNMKAAYFEVLSDLLTSLGVIAGGVIMLSTGWYLVDPILSAAIGLFIFPRTWLLLKDAVSVLLEGTPADVSLPALRLCIRTVEGVRDVHDLHVWSLTSGMNAMSAHVVAAEGTEYHRVLEAVRACILENFKISHVTIQVEPRRCDDHEAHL